MQRRLSLALRLLKTQPMLSLDELLADPLLQVWDAHRVVTAFNLALRQRRQPAIERWFFFSARE